MDRCFSYIHISRTTRPPGVVERACMHGYYSHADNVQSIVHIWPSVVYNNNDGCCAYNKHCCYNIHSVTIIDVKGKTTAGKKTTGRKTKAAGKNVTGRKTTGNKAAGKILRVAKSGRYGMGATC